MIDGIKVNIAGVDYTIPPMNLRIQLCDPTKDDVALIQQAQTADPAAWVGAAINVLHACAKRNYPDLDRDVLLDIDFGDLGNLVSAVMTKSGFAPRPLTSPAKASQPEPVSPSPEPASSD